MLAIAAAVEPSVAARSECFVRVMSARNYPMKRYLMILCATLVVLCNLLAGGTVQAASLSGVMATATPGQTVSQTVEQLKNQLMPQIESILTTEQRDQLESIISNGETSIRKAFKSITLSPEQKTKLASLLKTLPKKNKDLLTSMTPEQKKQFFMKKKEMFMPTAEEIANYKASEGGKE